MAVIAVLVGLGSAATTTVGDHPSWGTLAATVLGVVFMGGTISVIG